MDCKDKVINQEIERPSHYDSKGGRDVIDIAEEFGFINNAYVFNIFKYLIRAGRKKDNSVLQDALKARVYLNRFISHLENELEAKPTTTQDEKPVNNGDASVDADEQFNGWRKLHEIITRGKNDEVLKAVANRACGYLDEANRALDEGKSRREVMRDVLGLTDAEIDAIMGVTSKNRESPKQTKRKPKYFVRSNI